MMQETTKAYIAGFLDGDGSIMFQLIERKGYIYKYQIRSSVCFYQDSNHKEGLKWIRDKIGFGYIRDRNDGVSDYTVVGPERVEWLLKMVEPYVVFKAEHVKVALKLLNAMKENRKPSPGQFLELAKLVDSFAILNYSKKKKNNAANVKEHLNSKGLIPP
ncbi:MAG TPA: LAGLIDADG family homing endonuclease [Candidatus Omnitrophota bacterium]|nr:LAGLIDADG family homing endonuclease [Candidatus Omnitrophota bacterium]